MIKSTKKVFQVLLVILFLFLLSGCRSSLNRIEIGDEIYFWTVEQNLNLLRLQG